MQINDLLAQLGGIDSMSRDLGISPQQATSGVQALLPAILGGFMKQAQGGGAAGGLGGLGALGGLLGQLGGALPQQAGAVESGNDVLGQIFGSKDVSRTVAQHASAGSGIDPAILKRMLPIVAVMVAAWMAKQRAATPQPSPQASPMPDPQQAAPGGGLGDLLGGLLGGARSPGGAAGANAGAGGLGALGALLDRNGDGNVLDDILRMAGKTLR